MNSKPEQDLAHIRQMMEKSTKILSLSGLSGIFAGLTALTGAYLAYQLMVVHHINYIDGLRDYYSKSLLIQLCLTALGTFVVSVVGGIFFTLRKTKKDGAKLWTQSFKLLLEALLIPLITGGLVCLALLYKMNLGYVAPLMLVFYGLALVNAAKYTFSDVYYLGLLEISLGIIGMFWVGYGLILWAVGFGVLHIIYGILMYRKY